jgi:sugar lactone lactonase YvrE
MLDDQLTRRRTLSRSRLFAVGALSALTAAGTGLGLVASAETGDPPGTIRTIAGVTTNYRQGGFSGDGGKASDAQLYHPRAVAFSRSGEVFIGDALNHRIRKIDKDGVITTVAGSPTGTNASGSPAGSFGGDGGPATSAQLNQPHGVAVDSKGNVYVADSLNNRIRKIDTGGVITTVVGSDNKKGRPDGPAETAVLKFPKSMFMTADDELYICNSEGNTILKLDLKATPLTVKRVAGNLFAKRYGGDGGFATDAQLNTPQGVWVTPDNTVYFSDSENHLVRRVTADGKISTVAGDAEAARRAAETGQYPIAAESSGDGGPATSARLNGPRGIAADAAGNIFVAEEGGSRIRRIDPSGTITTIAGNGQPAPDGHNPHVAGDPGPAPALEAQFHTMHDLNIDKAGDLWVADSKNNRVRKISEPGAAPAADPNAAPATTTTTAPAAAPASTTTTAPAADAAPATTTTTTAAPTTTTTTAPASAPTTTTTAPAAADPQPAEPPPAS